MFDITFEDIFAEKFPNLTLLALSADISDAPTCDALWNEPTLKSGVVIV